MNKTVEYRCWISAKRKNDIKGGGGEEGKKRIFQKLSRHARDRRVAFEWPKKKKKKKVSRL